MNVGMEDHEAHAAARSKRAVGLAGSAHREAAKHLEHALEHHREAAYHLERGNHSAAKAAWKSARESMEAARYSHGELKRHHESFRARLSHLPEYGAPPKEAHERLTREGFTYNTSHHPDYATAKHHYEHPDGRQALVHERTDLKTGTSKHSIQYSKRVTKPGGSKFESCQLPKGRLRSFGDLIDGGRADQKSPKDFDPEALAEGTKHEMEHTNDEAKAREIAMDHLAEDPQYYKKLEKASLGAKFAAPAWISSEHADPRQDDPVTTHTWKVPHGTYHVTRGGSSLVTARGASGHSVHYTKGGETRKRFVGVGKDLDDAKRLAHSHHMQRKWKDR